MAEIVFSAPNESTLASEAARLGFIDKDGDLIVAGQIRSGGDWFLNVVGTLYEPQEPVPYGEEPPPPVARPGYWGRLRLNGPTDNVPSFSPAITQYVYSANLEGWTNDGVTLAPEWVGMVGLIA